MIQNPILPGFNPDPSICRVGDDYFLAVSSFEWFPAVPIYHSKDLKHWQLRTHALQSEDMIDLRRLPSAKGVWAPCLTYCEAEGLFYLMYSCMNSMNARFFDVDNFYVTAPSIDGPWSDPVYIHSAGFDPSMLHDDDGRKYIVSMEWETRDGYHKPGEICAVEYDPATQKIIGYPQRIWGGGTQRGCIEGPHIYKRDGYYYLVCAEGGTGYGHSVTVGRACSPFGPYESCPHNPILTATADFADMDDDSCAKPERFNPDSYLQKAGHGSFVFTQTGECYMVYHASRPLLPHLRCTLGRETCIQKMEWPVGGWPAKAGGGNRAEEFTPAPNLPAAPFPAQPSKFTFDGAGEGDDTLPLGLYAPRISPASFASIGGGSLRLRGQESLSSLNRASLIAHKLTSLETTVTTTVAFAPEVYQEYAGLTIYYDNMDYILLCKAYDAAMGSEVVRILRVENGVYTQPSEAVAVPTGATISMRLITANKEIQFSYALPDGDGNGAWHDIGGKFDLSTLSDEYCKAGEFTGTFVGLACVDAMLHQKCAEFSYFDVKMNGK